MALLRLGIDDSDDTRPLSLLLTANVASPCLVVPGRAVAQAQKVSEAAPVWWLGDG